MKTQTLAVLTAISAAMLYPAYPSHTKADSEYLPVQTVPETVETSITKTVMITAYSSTPDQTDSTPFTTASGIHVKDGIIAANFLPFGTMIKIPSLFGDKVFVVEDRMHQRKKNMVDIWMPTRREAIVFGAHKAKIVVLSVIVEPYEKSLAAKAF